MKILDQHKKDSTSVTYDVWCNSGFLGAIGGLAQAKDWIASNKMKFIKEDAYIVKRTVTYERIK